MQTLFKNLFNLINYWEYLYPFYSLKIFLKPSVKGTLRYQKINFFTTSASLNCIIWINGLSVKESLKYYILPLWELEMITIIFIKEI